MRAIGLHFLGAVCFKKFCKIKIWYFLLEFCLPLGKKDYNMQPAAKYFHVLLLVSEYFAQQSISLPRVPKIKIQQNFEIKFEKH